MQWVIMPYVGNLQETEQAVMDVLAQTLDVRLLLIRQGGGPTVDTADPRVFHWHHDPPLPSLAATWNRALKMVWDCGGEQALVVNNDVRLRRDTYVALLQVIRGTDAWFVSAVGTAPEQFDREAVLFYDGASLLQDHRGGPDFSCFLIDKGCHALYPFDEAFIPAFCEDLDYHRRLMLDGHGDKIFSVNLPYLHLGSLTLRSLKGDARAALELQISSLSRRHYQEKWGGPVNQERYTRPFDEASAREGVTTPELQHGQTS